MAKSERNAADDYRQGDRPGDIIPERVLAMSQELERLRSDKAAQIAALAEALAAAEIDMDDGALALKALDTIRPILRGALAQPTPTPWRIGQRRSKEGAPEILDYEGLRLAVVNTDADAAFVIRAVNNHEALVAALERAKGELEGWQAAYRPNVPSDLGYLDAALAQARRGA